MFRFRLVLTVVSVQFDFKLSLVRVWFGVKLEFDLSLYCVQLQ